MTAISTTASDCEAAHDRPAIGSDVSTIGSINADARTLCEQRCERLVCWLLRAACGLVLVEIFGLCLFAHPQIDDLFRASRVRDYGFLTALSMEYHGWSGRWLGTGLSYALSSVVDIRDVYPGLMIVLGALPALGMYGFLRGIVPRLSRRQAAGSAVLFLALYWTGTQSPGDTFYWMSGGLESHLSMLMVLLLFGGLAAQRLFVRARGRRATVLIAVFILAFLVSGVHELYGLFTGGTLLAGTCGAIAVRDRQWKVWACLLVVCGIGFYANFRAPGNAARMATGPTAGDIVQTIRLTTVQGAEAAYDWLRDLKLWAATLLLVISPHWKRIQPAWLARAELPWHWLVPATTAMLLLGGFAAPSWGAGVPMSPRTNGALYALFLVGWFFSVFVWTRRADFAADHSPVLHRVRFGTLAVLALALMANPHVRVGLKDLVVRAPEYDRAMHERYRLLARAKSFGQTEVELPPLPEEPTLFFHEDVINDPSHYRNNHTRKFYKLSAVRIAESSMPVSASPGK